MEDIIKIVKSLEDSSLLLKEVRGAIRSEAKEQLGTLVASLFVLF